MRATSFLGMCILSILEAQKRISPIPGALDQILGRLSEFADHFDLIRGVIDSGSPSGIVASLSPLDFGNLSLAEIKVSSTDLTH